uniref:Ig-like domain-containing protein n=1 Tax=Gopherus agassizii TaxID=38772 RepID=A0A452IQ47_9SAUR
GPLRKAVLLKGAPPTDCMGPGVVDHVTSQVVFYQHMDGSQQGSEKFTQEFDQDEILYVDLERKKVVWRLPEFSKFTSFEVQHALGNMAVIKLYQEKLIERSSHTRAQNGGTFPCQLGEPNVLICFMDKFFPPVLSLTWLKNGQKVTEGVYETDFYPHQDNSFRKFSYLPFFPSHGDFYDCQVEHRGLPKPFTKHWEAQLPTSVAETTETLVCTLGLAVGIIGIIAGTILIIKGMKMNAAHNPRGPL